MNKADLITVLKNETDLSKSEAESNSTVNIFCNLIRAIFKFASPEKWASHFTGQADIRKMSFRYSRL